MEYPFGFEGFENFEAHKEVADLHPSSEELQSYCERSFRSLAEVGQDEFMKIESHVSECDSCLVELVKMRTRLIREKPSA